MTASICQRVRWLPAMSGLSGGTAPPGMTGQWPPLAVLPAKPRHAGCGLISLPRLSAHDHDDVTVVSLCGELDLSGTAVLLRRLRHIRRGAFPLLTLTACLPAAAPPSASLRGAASRSGNGPATLPWVDRWPPRCARSCQSSAC